MSTQIKFREDKRVSQANLNSQEANKNHKNLVALSADYYSEWTTEKKFIEPPSGKSYQSRKMAYKKRLPNNGHGDLYASTTYNEIYNMADMCNFP
jgi:hypothetical protein